MTELLVTAALFCVATMLWQVTRRYELRGIIGFPMFVRREQTPRWFRLYILLLWLSFGLTIASASLMAISLVLELILA